MATRKCRNIYFLKYFMAVRKFTNIYAPKYFCTSVNINGRFTYTLFLVCFIYHVPYPTLTYIDLKYTLPVRPSAAARPRVAVPGETYLPTQVTTDTTVA